MENMKLQTRRLTNLIIISLIVLGTIVGVNTVRAQNSPIDRNHSTIHPLADGNILIFNNTAPVVDGALDSYAGEWADSLEYSTQFGGATSKTVSIRVKANYSHLFIAIEYVTTLYSEINTTVPVGDTYNNQSHNWYTIVFDQNFDNKIGSKLTPDDVILINFRQEGAVDAFINGTSQNSLVDDVLVGGANNSIAVLTAEKLDLPDEYRITIEIAKELSSGDDIGNDISLQQNDATRFKLLAWENQTAIYNSTLLSEVETPWMAFQLERLYDVYSYIPNIQDLNVSIYVSDSKYSNAENLSTIYYLLESYGLNVTLYSDADTDIDNSILNSTNLFIMVGAQTKLSKTEIETVRSYVSYGGSLLVLGDSTNGKSKLNNLLVKFGFEFYNATLVSKDPIVNNSLTINFSDYNDVPYLTEPMVLSNQSIGAIPYQGSAINLTAGFGEGYYVYQEGDLYPLSNVTGDYFIDVDGDFQFNKTVDIELNDTATTQVALELQRGGKVIACASADMYNSSNIMNKNLKTLLLREITWLLNMQFRINYEQFNVQETSIYSGDAIHVNITISSDNNTLPDNVSVWVVAMELKVDVDRAALSAFDNQGTYNGSIIPTHVESSYAEVSIRMHKRGYGYNETSLVEVTILKEIKYKMSLDPVATILFLASIGMAAVGTIAVKRYKPVEIEETETKKK